uniref:Membrane protein n=1 Tax=Pithovirus LCPAC403 TaxID=2506596 RepID=A0A481ZBK6_9VIRU|nr:MAG: membrane protein [Pithovirus LCPAC403]
MNDTGPNGFSVIIIIVFILVALAVFIWVMFIAPSSPEVDDEPDFNALFEESLSTEWVETSSEACLKYTFIFPDQPTLDTETLDNMEGTTFPANTIPLSDEIGAQKFTRVCNQSICTDDMDKEFSQGETQTLYRQCISNQNSEKTLALISVGFDSELPSNMCITQDETSLLLTECDPSDSDQLFSIERMNTQYAKITNKEGLCIVPGNDVIDPSTGENLGLELVMGPCPVNAFVWDLLNSKRYIVPDPTRTNFIAQQILFWNGPTDQTVSAANIVASDPLPMSMSVNPADPESLILSGMSVNSFQDPPDRFNTQILDYSFYLLALSLPTQVIPGDIFFPFFSNLPEIDFPFF